MKHNITFVIFTYNEERRIEYVLRCFVNYGNILLMDDGSTDRTIEIAHKYGAKVVRREKCDFTETEHILQQVYRNTEAEWIYWAYADEVLPKLLLEELLEISQQDVYKLVYIPKRNLTYGIEDFVLLKNDLNQRFFKRGYISFEDNTIHNMGKFLGSDKEILYLPRKKEYSIFHCSTYIVDKYMHNLNYYSNIEALGKQKNGRGMFVGLIIVPLYHFLSMYIREGNWRWGYAGFIMCMQLTIYRILVYSKVWELRNQVNIETIEERYDVIKEKLLSDIEQEDQSP